MKENFIQLTNGTRISINELKTRDLGITNLKSVIEMIISIIQLITVLVTQPIGFLKVVKAFKTIVPGFLTLIKHGKAVLDEIADLSIEEFEELTDFVLTKSTGLTTLEDVKDFLKMLTKLVRK